MDAYALLFASTLSAGTVLALAALGLLINERAGVINLGAAGMMLCAALAGFAATVHTGSTWIGFLAGMGAGALLAAIFGVLVIWLNTNQSATGLALSLFGAGFSAFAGLNYVQAKLPESPKYDIPFLADLPVVGPALFRLHPLVYGTIIIAVLLVYFLYRTRAGLILRSVGESPESAHALGYNVRMIRLGAVMAGGALCGLAGAYVSTVYTPLDCAGADHVCNVEARTHFAGCLPVWRRYHAAVSPAGNGRAHCQPVAQHVALCGDHRGAGADFSQSRVDSRQYAGILRKAFLSRLVRAMTQEAATLSPWGSEAQGEPRWHAFFLPCRGTTHVQTA